MHLRTSLTVGMILAALALFASPSAHAADAAAPATPAAPATAAAEMVDNPQYLSWSKHKTGTKVNMKQDVAMGAMNLSTTGSMTLLDLTPDKAVIEYATTVDIGGQKQEQKNKQDIPSKVEKGKEFAPPGGTGTAKEVGTEKVEVAGKSYDCKIIELTGEGQQGKATGKMWHTVEIPGGMAKMDITMQAPQQGTVKMTVTGMELK
jgi:hypothetical protein